MSVSVNIIKPDGQRQAVDGSVGIDVKPTIGIKITNNNLKDYVFELTVREALSGDLMIYDHKDIDIVLMQEKKEDCCICKRYSHRHSVWC